MNPKPNIGLIVTGSVAAIKALPLIEKLKGLGFSITAFLTRAPEEWGWVSVNEIRESLNGNVFTHKEPFSSKEQALLSSSILLIAPASADFLSQIVYASTDMGRTVQKVLEKGGRVMVAPAMNVKMWEHAAVQRNVAKLVSQGAVLLGPVRGNMACGDFGYGRLIDPEELAEGVFAAWKKIFHPATTYYETFLKNKEAQMSLPPRQRGDHILVALASQNIDWEAFENRVAMLRRLEKQARFIADPPWSEHKDRIEKVTQSPLVVRHFQCPDMKGLEHIRLPEKASSLYFPFIDRPLAHGMIRAKTPTLCLCSFLASKAPVVTTKEDVKSLPAALVFQLQIDGMTVYDDIAEIPAG